MRIPAAVPPRFLDLAWLPALLVLSSFALSALVARSAGASERPNLVFILTDNQGAWSLGCYGNPDIRTPHIDRMAGEGMRFTRAMSSNPVCSPTRATYLTGLIPSQHGLHSFLDPKYMIGPEAYYTLEEFDTLPGILSDEGYECGLVGKWHLGANLEPQDGFSYWVTMERGSTRDFYSDPIIEDGEIKPTPEYMTDFWTRHAKRFLEEQEGKDRPFFLYLAYNGPYNLSRLLLEPARNRHAEYYADKFLPSFPRDSVHPWQHANLDYHNNLVSIRRVAAETSAVDDGVGEVLQTLEALGFSENTLVVYASDQGWMGGQNGFFGMGDHTRPAAAHDLMMQVPLIFRQPGTVAEGSCDALVANYDFFPSVLEQLGLGHRIPESYAGPGRSFAAALRGEPLDWEEERMAYEMEGTRSYREERWKYVERRFPDGPGELYDLENDPMERFNLFGQSGLAEIQAGMAAKLEAFFDRYADPEYDLWKGGRSKCRLHYDPDGPGDIGVSARP